MSLLSRNVDPGRLVQLKWYRVVGPEQLFALEIVKDEACCATAELG